jgi:hypothetical protein
MADRAGLEGSGVASLTAAVSVSIEVPAADFVNGYWCSEIVMERGWDLHYEEMCRGRKR